MLIFERDFRNDSYLVFLRRTEWYD